MKPDPPYGEQLPLSRCMEPVAGRGLPDQVRDKFLHGNARRVLKL